MHQFTAAHADGGIAIQFCGYIYYKNLQINVAVAPHSRTTAIVGEPGS